MKPFKWNEEKNTKLKLERKLSFEDIESALLENCLRDIVEHPNQAEYSHQKIMMVEIVDYIHMVPFVEDEETIFLITIIPSRKMTKRYLRRDENE